MGTYTGDSAVWNEEIYVFDFSDSVLGGNDGTSNVPIKQLTDNGAYLKKRKANVIRGVGNPSASTLSQFNITQEDILVNTLYLNTSTGNWYRPLDATGSTWENTYATAKLNVKGLRINNAGNTSDYYEFSYDSASGGVFLKDQYGNFASLNAEGAILDYIKGTSGSVNINDGELLILAKITTAAQNTNGQFAVKRLIDKDTKIIVDSFVESYTPTTDRFLLQLLSVGEVVSTHLSIGDYVQIRNFTEPSGDKINGYYKVSFIDDFHGAFETSRDYRALSIIEPAYSLTLHGKGKLSKDNAAMIVWDEVQQKWVFQNRDGTLATINAESFIINGNEVNFIADRIIDSDITFNALFNHSSSIIPDTCFLRKPEVAYAQDVENEYIIIKPKRNVVGPSKYEYLLTNNLQIQGSNVRIETVGGAYIKINNTYDVVAKNESNMDINSFANDQMNVLVKDTYHTSGEQVGQQFYFAPNDVINMFSDKKQLNKKNSILSVTKRVRTSRVPSSVVPYSDWNTFSDNSTGSLHNRRMITEGVITNDVAFTRPSLGVTVFGSSGNSGSTTFTIGNATYHIVFYYATASDFSFDGGMELHYDLYNYNSSSKTFVNEQTSFSSTTYAAVYALGATTTANTYTTPIHVYNDKVHKKLHVTFGFHNGAGAGNIDKIVHKWITYDPALSIFSTEKVFSGIGADVQDIRSTTDEDGRVYISYINKTDGKLYHCYSRNKNSGPQGITGNQPLFTTSPVQNFQAAWAADYDPTPDTSSTSHSSRVKVADATTSHAILFYAKGATNNGKLGYAEFDLDTTTLYSAGVFSIKANANRSTNIIDASENSGGNFTQLYHDENTNTGTDPNLYLVYNYKITNGILNPFESIRLREITYGPFQDLTGPITVAEESSKNLTHFNFYINNQNTYPTPSKMFHVISFDNGTSPTTQFAFLYQSGSLLGPYTSRLITNDNVIITSKGSFAFADDNAIILNFYSEYGAIKETRLLRMYYEYNMGITNTIDANATPTAFKTSKDFIENLYLNLVWDGDNNVANTVLYLRNVINSYVKLITRNVNNTYGMIGANSGAAKDKYKTYNIEIDMIDDVGTIYTTANMYLMNYCYLNNVNLIKHGTAPIISECNAMRICGLLDGEPFLGTGDFFSAP